MDNKCAYCRLKRKTCGASCGRRDVFPAEMLDEVTVLDNLYDFRKLKIFLRDFNVSERKQIIRSMAAELKMRVNDPVGGCWAAYQAKKKELEELEKIVAILEAIVVQQRIIEVDQETKPMQIGVKRVKEEQVDQETKPMQIGVKRVKKEQKPF